MPAKKAKVAKAAKAANPPDAAELLPFKATTEARNALLPYLAMGFIPMTAPGGANMCGLHALHRSYNHARRALRPTYWPAIHEISYAQFALWFKSAEYAAKVQEELDGPAGFGEDQREELMRPNYLDVSQLALILSVANDAEGTNFRIGVVTEGYRGRRGRNGGAYEHDFVEPTNARIGFDDRPSAGPVLWLWHDNGISIGRDHSGLIGGKAARAHWEPLGPVSAARNAINVDQRRKQRVQAWGLGQDVIDDINNGVWILIQDCLGGSNNELSALKGEFVRNSPPQNAGGAGLEIPGGCRFVATCFGRDAENASGLLADNYNSHFGIVEEEKLLAVELSLNAPVPPPSRDGGDGDDSAGGGGAGSGDDSSDHGNDKKAASITVSRRAFRIFRVIRPTDKTGLDLNTADPESHDVEGFPIYDGEFLLDSTQRVNGHAFVTNIDGQEGGARFRSLQYLENPWGLPDEMEVKAALPILERDGSPTIRAEAKKRGLKSVGCKKKIYDSIVEHDREQEEEIPMFTVVRALTAEAASSTVAFRQNELVFRTRLLVKGKKGRYLVRDFEGNEGIIARRGLDKIDHPWKFTISPQQRIVLENAKKPKKTTTPKRRLIDDSASDSSDGGPAPKKPRTTKTTKKVN